MGNRVTGFALAALWAIPATLAAQGGPLDSAFLAASSQIGSHWHWALQAHEALGTAAPRDEDVLRAVGAELVLGRPERARVVLGRHRLADPALALAGAELEAAGAYSEGDFGRAATLFAQVAVRSGGSRRGLLQARAADAFDRAGRTDSAALLYRAARQTLPQFAGWLALREAGATADTAAAFPLLDSVAPAARPLIPAIQGRLLAASGDTVRAIAVLSTAGLDGTAAQLALARRDSATARMLAYRALQAGDTAVARTGIALAEGVLPPREPAELLALARALRRGSAARAADLAGRAVAGGDSSSAALMLWGDLLSDARRYQAALTAYTRAASASADASLAAARTMVRLGRPLAAARGLSAFLAAHPDHPGAPLATYLWADLEHDAGRRSRGDSLLLALVRRWPRHEYASSARTRLASVALQRRDSAAAAGWYRDEIEARGSQQHAARYFLGGLALAARDSAGALAEWSALARQDSLGYYGALARSRAGLPAPVIDRAPARDQPEGLRTSLAELDFLDQAEFVAEASALVAWLQAQEQDPEATLDLADALAQRERTAQAINLGWRAARSLTLNHPRVLRVVYPWPVREIVEAEAREFGLDPFLLAALIRQESGFDAAARSRAGARGLMQVMPGTAREAARRLGVEWTDQFLLVPDANIHVGASHLAALLRRYGGDVVTALAAYNAGSRPVERWRRQGIRDPAMFVERIPYPETRGYVRSVIRNRDLYRALYGPALAP